MSHAGESDAEKNGKTSRLSPGFLAQALGMKTYQPYGSESDQQVWNKGWAAADIATKMAAGIKNILNYMTNRYGSAMEKTFSEEHHHQD